jgi:hypothetical protein
MTRRRRGDDAAMTRRRRGDGAALIGLWAATERAPMARAAPASPAPPTAAELDRPPAFGRHAHPTAVEPTSRHG